jgi:hypothetical protein
MAYMHILYRLILDRFIATLQETNTQFLDAVLSGSIEAVFQHSRFARAGGTNDFNGASELA